MEVPDALIPTHPEGEGQTPPRHPSGNWPIDTPGGRFYAEWDDQAPATREGQLIFFFQLLQAGGRWKEFLRGCPLHYTGNRGSGARNVMGTAMLSILCGHWRYAHINAVRGDGINPGLLGMDGTVSEERRSATTRKSPAAPATSITATSWQICASASAWKCGPATSTPPPKACPASGKRSKSSPATNGPPSPEATAATAAKPSCSNTRIAPCPISSNCATPPKSKTSSCA